LKYREENVDDIIDDKQRIKENVKKIKEKFIQRINQMEKELTSKLDILGQENAKFLQDEISIVLAATEKVESYLIEMFFVCHLLYHPHSLLYISIYSCTFD
jgi:hypothetical protein